MLDASSGVHRHPQDVRIEQAASPRREEPQASTAFLSAPAITLGWIVRLRWGAVLGQALTIAIATTLFGLRLPLGPLAAIVGLASLTNFAIYRWMRGARTVTSAQVAAVLALDTVLLSSLLFLTGGPSNPFSVLFLVQITLAALVLGMRYAGFIILLSTAAYAFLFFDNVPLAGMEHVHHAGTSAFNLHLQGMFVAFLLAAGTIAYFVTRVSGALRERDAELARAQRLAASNEKLASLTTLAAGAAHELGSPLATIAVASKELERAAEGISGAEPVRDDARLIRQEVDRCRDIVHRMSVGSGNALGEAPERVDVEDIVFQLRTRLGAERSARLDVRASGGGSFRAPWRGLVQALASLVNNAFDATEALLGRVEVSIEAGGSSLRVTIVDHGAGMPPEVLARVGEPFFTTKAPGSGMGLGVLLVRAFADRVGARFALTSAVGEGTKAVLEVPVEGG
jgi:two-component system, sensor histidine kinase RegB